MSVDDCAAPKVVTRDEWEKARKDLLQKEKAFTKEYDRLSAERRRLPAVKIEKDYLFEGQKGKRSLKDLFDGRKQLIVYHFMFDPENPPGKGAPYSEGCDGCSFATDNFPHLSHLNARDTTLTLISRAPYRKIRPFKERMGWTVPWYSSFGSDFNYDFHVTTDEKVAPVKYNYNDKDTLEAKKETYHISGEQPGLSVFLQSGNNILHTYSTYGRGLEQFLTTYHLLDLTPYGRQEDWEDSPAGWPKGDMMWVKHHDKYSEASAEKPDCCSS
jgi:predicted dithiol-disulfide oxidoreductase (DUF899 family)